MLCYTQTNCEFLRCFLWGYNGHRKICIETKWPEYTDEDCNNVIIVIAPKQWNNVIIVIAPKQWNNVIICVLWIKLIRETTIIGGLLQLQSQCHKYIPHPSRITTMQKTNITEILNSLILNVHKVSVSFKHCTFHWGFTCLLLNNNLYLHHYVYVCFFPVKVHSLFCRQMTNSSQHTTETMMRILSIIVQSYYRGVGGLIVVQEAILRLIHPLRVTLMVNTPIQSIIQVKIIAALDGIHGVGGQIVNSQMRIIHCTGSIDYEGFKCWMVESTNNYSSIRWNTWDGHQIVKSLMRIIHCTGVIQYLSECIWYTFCWVHGRICFCSHEILTENSLKLFFKLVPVYFI